MEILIVNKTFRGFLLNIKAFRCQLIHATAKII